jgi:hypothetical protein
MANYCQIYGNYHIPHSIIIYLKRRRQPWQLSVGTTAPASRLHIEGGAFIAGPKASFQNNLLVVILYVKTTTCWIE